MDYGLLGRKLGHSFSPEIHRAFGCPEYGLIELEPEELAAFFEKKDFKGLNVTIPYKLSVMPLVDEISPEALEIGSVNTIVNEGGRLKAYNTDIYGFEYMLASSGISPAGKKALVLGSGGASLTAKAALKRLGAREIVTVSRSGPDNYGNLEKHYDAEVIVNATPVGMFPNCPASPLSLSPFKSLIGVADVVYNPARTGLLMEAERLGIPHVGGLGMLVAQAKRAEELFFGVEIADSEIERIACEIFRTTQNLVLVGMPGTGKTTAGKNLQRLSGRTLYDTDELIEKKAGISIPQLIAESGEAELRRLETEVIFEVGKLSGAIIVCGGGAVTQERNYPLLHQNGRIIQLYRDISSLSVKNRPLSKDMETVKKMYEIRKPMYEAFRDSLIEAAEKKADNALTAERVWRNFCENTCY